MFAGMYIRRTQTRNTSTGESYYTHRLVRSERVGGKVRQRTLLNLGRHFDVAQEHWPLLCQRIEQIHSGQNPLFEQDIPPSVERHVQRILARLIARESGKVRKVRRTEDSQQEQPETEPEPSGDIQSVDVDSLTLTRPRSVGVEQLALWSMKQVEFVKLLEELGMTGPQRAAVLGSVIGRMAEPASELATHRWLGERSGLGELLDFDFESMSLMQLYRVSDLLFKRRKTIEQHLFQRISSLFSLSTTVTLYDLTNTYFEGNVPANPKARRGHSKEKRSDCPLLTLGLVLDGSGFVRRSEVFAGNVAEMRTLEEMLSDLNAPAGSLVVMDRGIATEENLGWLREQGYRYLVVSRERSREFDASNAITINTAGEERVQLSRKLSEDGNEVRLYCYSERRARKEEGITQRFAERFEAELQKLSDGLSRPRAHKRIDKLWERIGRLKQKSHGAGQHYHIEIKADESGKRASAISWTRTPVKGTMLTDPGVYCLRSNEIEWDEERLWRTYMMLTDLEAVFRSLKSELGLRPVYHHKEERSDGHLFITVLAYQFVQIIRHQLREKGVTDSWATLRKTLAGRCRITVSFSRSDGRMLHVRKATRPEQAQQTIYHALDIHSEPGGVIKTIV
jgi:transposase